MLLRLASLQTGSSWIEQSGLLSSTSRLHLVLIASSLRGVLTAVRAAVCAADCLCMLRTIAMSSLGSQGVQSTQCFICYLHSCMKAPAGAAVAIAAKPNKEGALQCCGATACLRSRHDANLIGIHRRASLDSTPFVADPPRDGCLHAGICCSKLQECLILAQA